MNMVDLLIVIGIVVVILTGIAAYKQPFKQEAEYKEFSAVLDVSDMYRGVMESISPGDRTHTTKDDSYVEIKDLLSVQVNDFISGGLNKSDKVSAKFRIHIKAMVIGSNAYVGRQVIKTDAQLTFETVKSRIVGKLIDVKEVK